MESIDYISDSDGDGGDGNSILLDPSTVSSRRLQRILSHLPTHDKQALTKSLQKSGYDINEHSIQDENLIHEDNNTSREESERSSNSFSPPKTYNIDELFSDITYASEEERLEGIADQHQEPKSSQYASQLQTEQHQDSSSVVKQTQQAQQTHAIELDQDDDLENMNHLRAYLGSKSNPYGRRGLRDRSFANAHPYLADSAHWMGLARVDVLNDIYKDNHDVELIVKLLNQKYLKNKKTYPKDEKFRPKNFYAFLGKGKGEHKQRDQKQDDNNEQPSSSIRLEDASSQQYSDIPSENRHSDYESQRENYELSQDQRDSYSLWQEDHDIYGLSQQDDVFDFPISQPSGSFPQETFAEERQAGFDSDRERSDLESQESDASEDESSNNNERLVSVGGRLLKERSILKGALPESAKRLSIYQPKQRKYDSRKSRVLEQRKGLAMKKRKKPLPKFNPLSGFVDDNEYDTMQNDIYVHSDPSSPPELSELTSLEEPPIAVFSKANHSEHSFNNNSSAEEMEAETDEADEDDDGGFGMLPQNVQEADWEVIEDDRIDPMFANTFKRSGTSTNKGKVKRRKKDKSAPIWKSDAGRKTTSASEQSHKRPRAPRQSILFGSQRSGFGGFTRPARSGNRASTSTSTSTSKYQSRLPLAEVKDGLNRAQGVLSPRKQNNQKAAKTDHPKKIKEALKSDYYFSRNPVMATVAIETESENRFVKSLPKKAKAWGASFESRRFNQLFTSDSNIEFPNHFLFSRVDYTKLSNLRDGYTKVIKDERKDSVFVVLLGQTYSFSILNKSASQESTLKLLKQFSRILSDNKLTHNSNLQAEVYDAICGLIEWFLISQELPKDEACWQVLYFICNEFDRKIGDSREKLLLFPYFILLLHIWIQIGISLGINSALKYPHDGFYFSKIYFNLLLEHVSPSVLQGKLDGTGEGITSQFESLYVIHTVCSGFESGNGWWIAIDEGLKRVRNNSIIDSSNNLLDSLHILSVSITSPKREAYKLSWVPFYTLYSSFSSVYSHIYDRFLDVVFNLKDQFFWPLEERLLVMIYSLTITVRKFSNFANEVVQPQIIGRLITRDSIPESSYFEKFMYLLFSYVSELPLNDSAKKKRLITKLYTSSHFMYESNSKSLTMYVNRFNFILLLSQLSNHKIDLTGQVIDLVRHIENSMDLDFYRVTIDGLESFTDIAREAGGAIPIESYSRIIGKVALTYKTKKFVECLDLWGKIKRQIRSWKENELALHVFCDVDFLSFDDSMLHDIVELVFDNLNASSLEKNTILATTIHHKVFSVLQIQMGRLPLANDHKIVPIIEICLKIWIHLVKILHPTINWNELIFQKYPYMGNEYSRDKFKLFFYIELINYVNVSEYLDTYLTAMLQYLLPGKSSEYQGQFFNSLRNKLSLFQFKTELTPKVFSNQQFNSYKLMILESVFQNLFASTLTETSKEFYVHLYVGYLSKEIPDIPVQESSLTQPPFPEYIKQVELLRKIALKYVETNSTFRDLTRMLGLSKFDLENYAWSKLSLIERLRIFHLELTKYILQEESISSQVVLSCIDAFVATNGGEFDMIYHYGSIIIQDLQRGREIGWIRVYWLLKYIVSALNKCQINLSDGNFSRFISLELPKLAHGSAVQLRQPEFKMLTFSLSTVLLKKVYYVSDGFKDQFAFKDIILQFISNYLQPHLSDMNLHTSFSEIQPGDVIPLTSQNVTVNLELQENENFEEKEIQDMVTLLTNLLPDEDADRDNGSHSGILLDFEI